MKTVILIILFLSVGLVTFSQIYQINWQQCFGGSDSDEAYDIIVTENGYLIAGATKSYDGDVSYNHGTTDGWLIKTDNYGNLIWEKSFGGSWGDGIFRIFPADENNYYLLNSSYSSDGDISNDPYPESTDFWIVKIDSSGNIIWDRILGGNMLDQMWTGTPTYDGGVVALGWTGSNDGDISQSYGGADMWMIKINSNGIKQWDFSIGTDGFDYGHAIIQTSDSGFLVGGTATIGEGGNLTCEPYNYNAEAILVKIDADQNIQWQQCYGGSADDGITALIEVSDGYVFGGYVNSDDGDISGWHGKNDIWIVKVDFFGDIIWQKCIGGSRSEFVSKLLTTNSETIIVPGRTQSHDGDVSGNHTLSEHDFDIWILYLSAGGEIISQQCIGGIFNEREQFGAIINNEHNIVIAGETNFGPSFDVECTPYGGNYDRDFWVFEISDTTVSVEEVGEQVIKVYPNPAVDYVVFEVPPPLVPPEGGKTPILRIHNIFGQEVAQIPINSEITVWDTRGIKNGIYFYQIYMDCTIKSGKIIVSK